MVRLCEVQKPQRFIARQASQVPEVCIGAGIVEADSHTKDGARSTRDSLSADGSDPRDEETLFSSPPDFLDDEAHRLHAEIFRRQRTCRNPNCLRGCAAMRVVLQALR
jgi:hypothetical protein